MSDPNGVSVALHEMHDSPDVEQLRCCTRCFAIEQVGIEGVMPGEAVNRRLGAHVWAAHLSDWASDVRRSKSRYEFSSARAGMKGQ